MKQHGLLLTLLGIGICFSFSNMDAKADLALACTGNTGGVTEGVIDCDNFSVVTLDATDIDANDYYSAIKLAYSAYRTAHSGGSPIDVAVMYSNDTNLKIGNFYWKVDDNGTDVGVATVSPISTLTTSNGFTPVNLILAHEIGHQWMNLNVIRPVVASGNTSSGGVTGKLTDNTANFTTKVKVGDRIRFPVAVPGDKWFQITAVTSTELTFGNRQERTNDYDNPGPGGAGSTYCPANTANTFAPAASAAYEVEAWDMVARQCAHWTTTGNTDASFMDGNEIEDLGNGSFKKIATRIRYGKLDLYMMDLLQGNELTNNIFSLSGLSTPISDVPINGTFTATKRSFTIQEVRDGWTENYDPRNFRMRFMVVTTIGKSVPSDQIETASRIRQDWNTSFQELTNNRGTITSTISEASPDLVISSITPLNQAKAGTTYQVKVKIHNQSSVATNTTHKVRITWPWSGGATTDADVAAMAANEIVEKTLSVSVPAMSSLFGVNDNYRASFNFTVTIDPLSAISESDEVHNTRQYSTQYADSVGNSTASTLTLNGAGVGNTFNYFEVRSVSPTQTQIDSLAVNDPRNLGSRTSLVVNEVITDLAVNNDVLAAVTQSGKVLAYALPIAFNSTPIETITGFASGPGEATKLALSGTTLYVVDHNGITPITGFDKDGTSTKQTLVNFNGNLSLVLPADAMIFNGDLYVYVSHISGTSAQQFSISTPSTPSHVRSFNVGAGSPETMTAYNGQLYLTLRETGIKRFQISNGNSLSGITDTTKAWSSMGVSGNGDFITVHRENSWVVYAIGGDGSLTEQAVLMDDTFTGTLQTVVGSMAGWTTLSSSNGTIFYSPTGIIETFVRGDTNQVTGVDIADSVRILLVKFAGATYLGYQDAFDVNDNGAIDITDVVFQLSHLFLGGPNSPAPYPNAGTDPTADSLIFVKPRD